MKMNKQRYIPEILEEILEELKKMNASKSDAEIETRPLSEDKPKRGRKPLSKILGYE